MVKDIIYRSFDGEVFSTEEECLNYESNARSFLDGIRFWDKDKKELFFNLEQFFSCYRDAFYMFIPMKSEEEYFDFNDFVSNFTNSSIWYDDDDGYPHSGYYYYNDGLWHDIDKEIEELQAMRNIMQ